MATAAAIGGTISAIRVNARDRRALAVGETGDRRQIQRPTTAVGMARSAALGGSVGAGLMALAGIEYALAEGSTALVSRALGRSDDKVTPLVGHSIAAALMVPAGFGALTACAGGSSTPTTWWRPPTRSPHQPVVTAGPASLVSFDDIGKEGRRFVLMTLIADEIADVMGEPAVDPIRAIAGFESAGTPETRADLALAELEALGAYERSMIVVAAPTGVGYVNYSFAEALEYLTRGDCAIVVPQYALVPSALALNETNAGVQMQTLILRGIRDRIAALPEGHRPRLLQFGESLGAQVALDVAREGTAAFDELGIDGGCTWARRSGPPCGTAGSTTRARPTRPGSWVRCRRPTRSPGCRRRSATCRSSTTTTRSTSSPTTRWSARLGGWVRRRPARPGCPRRPCSGRW